MSWKANVHLFNSDSEKTGSHLELEKHGVSEESFTLWSIIHTLSSWPHVTEGSGGHLGSPLAQATQDDTASKWEVWPQGNTKPEENKTIADVTEGLPRKSKLFEILNWDLNYYKQLWK